MSAASRSLTWWSEPTSARSLIRRARCRYPWISPMSPKRELNRSDMAMNQNRTRSALRLRSTGGAWAAALTPEIPSSTTAPRQGGAARVARAAPQLLLDAQELVVLGHALAARRGARLDLTHVQRDRQVGDEGVLGLA